MDMHWFVYSRKNYIKQHEPRGARFFPDYFNQTNPQWRRRCNIIITPKNTCLTSGSTQNIVSLQVMCELKIAQLKLANTISTNPSVGGEAEFVRLLNDDISDEIPRFASVQSNSIA